MTVKEAERDFGVSAEDIRQCIKDGMLKATKVKGKYIIPDDTKIIIAKKSAQSFLLQIIKYKNNEHAVISRKECPSLDELKILAAHLYESGLIGTYVNFESDIDFFTNVKLTDEGLNMALGLTSKKLNLPVEFSIKSSLNINIGLANVG